LNTNNNKRYLQQIMLVSQSFLHSFFIVCLTSTKMGHLLWR